MYYVATFGVQTLVLTKANRDEVCLQCLFASFSSDTGCTVELVSFSVQYKDTFSRVGDIAEGCVYGVTPGQYNITAYDQRPAAVVQITQIIDSSISSTPIGPQITSTTGSCVCSLDNACEPGINFNHFIA